MKATTSIERHGVKISVEVYKHPYRKGEISASDAITVIRSTIRSIFMDPWRTQVGEPTIYGDYSGWWAAAELETNVIVSVKFSLKANSVAEANTRVRGMVSYLFRHQQPIKDIEAGLFNNAGVIIEG